jgi:PAS domain-containing protein
MTNRHYHFLQSNPLWLEAFRMTDDEFRLNRQGQLSRSQRRRVWIDHLPTLLSAVALWFAIGVIYSIFRADDATAVATQCLAVMLVVALVGAMFAFLRATRLVSTLRVSVATGVAKLEERTDRYGGLFLHIDGRNFELKRHQFNLIQDGMTLAVYYVTPRKRVLAIEPIVFHDPE